jgi:thiamine-phosphate pyrophosphorylase
MNSSKNYNKKSVNNISSISIVLREKDLNERDYELLASKVIRICEEYNTECILHTYYNVARKLGCSKIHLPLHILKSKPYIAEIFDVVGVSIHSVDDALDAKNMNVTYVTAGHIFNTDCKKDIPARGLAFLNNIVNSVDIPVFAIGGITSSNIDSVINSGAFGVCIMSGFMNIENIENFFL